jgi:tetratricopeptide (TPR) repeat protein
MSDAWGDDLMARNPMKLDRDEQRVDPQRAGVLDAATEAALAHARQLTAQGRYRDALAVCRRLRAGAPAHSDILGLLGWLYAQTGSLKQGLENLAEALVVGPRSPIILYHLAQVYLQAGAPVHALHSLRGYWTDVQALPVALDLPDPQPLMAALVIFMREEEGFPKVNDEFQDRAMMSAERGRLRLLFNDDPAQALGELREAIRLAPKYPQPRNNLSLAYFYNGQADRAIATLETTLREVSPNNVYALATLAFIRWMTGGAVAGSLALLERAAAALEPQSRLLDRTRVAEVAGLLGAHALAYRVLAPDGETALQPAPAEEGQAGAARNRLLATALANLDRADEATALLRESPALPADPLAQRLLTAIDTGETLPALAGGGYPYVGWHDLLSLHLLRRLAGTPGTGRRLPLKRHRAHAAPDAAQVARQIVTVYPRLTLACALLIWMGEPLLEQLALTLLALAGTPPAEDLLEAHLRGTAGSYAGRQQAGYALVDSGRLPNETTLPFWSGTAWGELRLFRLTPHPRDVRALHSALQALLQKLDAPGDT